MARAARYDAASNLTRLPGAADMRTSFAVNDMTIHRIVEQEYGFTPLFEFLPTLTKEHYEENRSWMEPSALTRRPAMSCCASSPTSSRRRTTTSWSMPASATIRASRCVRPGTKKDDNWMRALKAAGLGVEDIDFVMCTHLHGDHVGWNTRLENGRWVPTFPKARYLFSKKEYEYWTSSQQTMMPPDPIKESVLPVVEANRAELVTSDHALNDHIRLTPTPGHTPDHFAVCAGRGGDQAVFTGDLIHSPIQARYP